MKLSAKHHLPSHEKWIGIPKREDGEGDMSPSFKDQNLNCVVDDQSLSFFAEGVEGILICLKIQKSGKQVHFNTSYFLS